MSNENRFKMSQKIRNKFMVIEIPETKCYRFCLLTLF